MPALAASNHRIRRLRRLSGRRSARADDRAFVLEGPTPIAEAIQGGHRVEAVYLDEAADGFEALVELATHHDVPVHRVAAGVLQGVTDTVTPRPLVAVVEMPTTNLSEVIVRAARLRRPLVVLAEVRDPGNVGTIIRSADASGVAGVVCTTGTADPWAPKVVRSSAGSVLHVPIVTGAPAGVVSRVLGEEGVPVFVTSVSGGVPYDQAPLDGVAALVVGSEAHGVPDELANGADHTVTIPMEGGAESLNVAIAASVLMFDALRQRRAHSDWTPAPADDKVNTS